MSEPEPVVEEPEPEPVAEPEPEPEVVASPPKSTRKRGGRGRKRSEAVEEEPEPIAAEEPAAPDPIQEEEDVEETKRSPRKRPRRADPVEKPNKRSRSAKEATPEAEADATAEDAAVEATAVEKKDEDWVLLEHPTEEETAEMKEQEKKVEEAKESAKSEKVKSPEKEKVKPAEEPNVDHDEAFAEVESEDGDDCPDCAVEEGKVGIDRYYSDMNLVVSPDGCMVKPLVKNGFSYLWAGGQANMGVKSGKICFEVRVLGPQEVTLPEDEELAHGVRVGWSADPTNLQLGEASLSYGYESTGKVCASSSFFAYGQAFGEGDVVGAYIDLESEPKALKFTKNGEDLGVAMSLSVKLEKRERDLAAREKEDRKKREEDEEWLRQRQQEIREVEGRS